MPQEKIGHFLELLFSRGLLQNVAYGVNKIKFASSEQQKVANATLTMKYSHTIAFYKEIYARRSTILQCLINHYGEFSMESTLHKGKPWQVLMTLQQQELIVFKGC